MVPATILTKICLEPLEGRPIYAIGPQEPVGDHGLAQISLAGKLADMLLLSDDSLPLRDVDLIKRPRGQQPLGGNIVAELLNLGFRVPTAETRLAKQQVGQLVQERA